jgi:cytochrome c oxidase cbb3-type subunit 2
LGFETALPKPGGIPAFPQKPVSLTWLKETICPSTYVSSVKLTFIYSILLAAAGSLLLSGCKPNANHQASKPKLQASPASLVTARITFSDLPVPPKPQDAKQTLERGKTVYGQNCLACHGEKGDGNGPAAAFLLPKPRDFIEARYRLRSTPTGQLPTDVDLFRAVSLGMPGTPMPPWKHSLSDEDRWAVVEYIKSFSPRFSDPNETKTTVVNLGPPPQRDETAIAQGKALFAKCACASCHGESGHGDGPSVATLVDDRQLKIKPRDFSRPSIFKSGYATKEIARTILTGFNGTPMAGFHGTIAESDAWKIAYYVETFAKF